MKRFLASLLVSLLCLFAAGPAKAQNPQWGQYVGGNFVEALTPNCVVYATAGGTSDAITVPLLANPSLPCAPRQTLLILLVTHTNTTISPTLQPVLYPAQLIINAAGSPVSIGELVAGSIVGLMNDGTHWRIVFGLATAGGFSPICGDGSGIAFWLNCNQTYSFSQRGSDGTVTPSGSTFTPDFNTKQHYTYQLLNGANTIANPTNLNVSGGQVGMFELVQPASGAAGTVTWGTNYIYGGGISTLVLSGSNNAVDYLPYYVTSTGNVLIGVGGLNAFH